MSTRRQHADLFGAARADPPTYRCDTCGQEACYGVGWPASPLQRWFCRAHVPTGFLPADRQRCAA